MHNMLNRWRLQSPPTATSAREDGTGNPRSRSLHACYNCRSKKIKCSGEQAGCSWCLSQDLPCEYSCGNKRNSLHHSVKPMGQSHNAYEDICFSTTLDTATMCALSLPDRSTGTIKKQSLQRGSLYCGQTTHELPHPSSLFETNTIGFDTCLLALVDSKEAELQKVAATSGTSSLFMPNGIHQVDHEWTGYGTKLSLFQTNMARCRDLDQPATLPLSTNSTFSWTENREPLNLLSYSSPHQSLENQQEVFGMSYDSETDKNSCLVQQSSCPCLSSIICVLEEFDAAKQHEERLDCALEALRQAIHPIMSFLGCDMCRAKRENVKLVVMLFMRLVEFTQMLSLRQDMSGTLNSSSKEEDISAIASVGDYQTSKCCAEWSMIMNCLAVFQVKRLSEVSGQLNDLATCANHRFLVQQLSIAQCRLDAVRESLRSRA